MSFPGYPPGGYGAPPGAYQQPPAPPPPPRDLSGAAIVLIILVCVVVLGIGGCFMCTCGIRMMGNLPDKPAPSKPIRASGVRDPDRACALLTSAGVPGRPWRRAYSGTEEFVCSSEKRSLGGVGLGGDPNFLWYVVEGREAEAQRAKVLLDVFAPTSAAPAQQEMARACDTLFTAVLGRGLPPEIRTNIIAARPGSWTIANHKVSLERDGPYRDGRGYGLKLTLDL